MTTNTPGIPAAGIGENPYQKLMSGYSAAIEVRDKWKALFDDCYELTMPGRETFEATTAGTSRTDSIFDETAVTGVQEFASRLQAGLVPTYAQWIDLAAGSDVPEEEREEVNDSLKGITKKVFDTLQNSNFNQEVHESFMDLSISTGVLLARD